MSAPSVNQYHRGLLMLLGGSLADSSSGLFTRLISADAPTMSFWRGIFAFLAMLCFVAWKYRSRTLQAFLRIGGIGALMILVLAFGMVANLASLRLTAVANFFMIFATAPFAAAIFGRIFLREPLDAATLVAGAVGFCGIAIMMAGSARSGGLAGDLLALLVVFLYSTQVTLFRRFPTVDILPIIAVTTLFSGLIAWPLAHPGDVAARDLGLLALFGACQLALGNILIFSAASRIPAAQAGLLGVMNSAFAPLWVWLFLREVPPEATLIGGGIVIAASLAHFAWKWFGPAPDR
ncbi:MAG: DMT family transporter [Hyphomicrobiales bacterium]